MKSAVRKTRRSVYIADRVSRWLISISGIGTILAVLLVFVFLVLEAIPLFLRASVNGEIAIALPDDATSQPPAYKDPKRLLAWSLTADGTLLVTRIGDARVLEKRKLFPAAAAVTAQSSPLERVNERSEPYWDVAFGFADGSTSRTTLRFKAETQLLASLTKEQRELDIGRATPLDNGLLLRDGLEYYVKLTVTTELQLLTAGTSNERVTHVALAFGDKGPVTALLTADGKLALIAVQEKRNLGTGEVVRKTRTFPLSGELPPGRSKPDDLRLSHLAEQVYLLWNDGFYQRLDARTPASAAVAGTGYLLGKDRSGLAHLRHVILATDEEQRLAWTLTTEGVLIVFRLDTGEQLERRSLFDAGPPLTASSQPVDRAEQVGGQKENYKEISFGFLDGGYRIGRLRIKSTFLDPATLTPEVLRLREGQVLRLGAGLVVRTPQGQYRLDEVKADVKPAVSSPAPDPIRLIDHALTRYDSSVCVMTESGSLRRDDVKLKTPLDGRPVTFERLGDTPLNYQQRETKAPPDLLLVNATGDGLYLIWNDGHFQRMSLTPGHPPAVVETDDFLDRGGETRITQVRQMLGRQTLLVGDSSGRLRAWFPTISRTAATRDGFVTIKGHEFAGPAAPITALAGTSRSRLIAVGHDNGAVRVLQVTSEKDLADLALDSDQPITLLAVAPKEDGVIAFSNRQGRLWKMDPKHPEITMSSLFDKVWYEGADEPRQAWEASSGDDAFEPKFGLVPLIFGTLKASFYSLLFGVPLALLAALYTSESMRPGAKAIVKPVIETMASLPSVVLGFLAGLVFAQFIENVVPAVLCAFVLVPLSFVLFAHLTQLLPEKASRRVSRYRFLLFLPALAAGLLAAFALGPVVERLLFAGNLQRWLADKNAGMFGGWMLLYLPLSVVLTLVLMARFFTPELRRRTARWRRTPVAWIDFARFLFGCSLALGMAVSAAQFMEWLGANPRGKFIDVYSQRNALVVGFVMGFAIIPIIYTIAEDALSSVPEHLRSGSLATGATPWQTATRIVIPTAMSGLFSAVMVGMGRAIGETMIVVMATGNTPVMEWNIFNGFRTLSANLAVELPEAACDSTHYRTLFLAALVLFVMTFVLNTIAELVRLRFRKRAYQL